MRLHSGLLSIATTPTQPTSGSLTFRMVSVCSPAEYTASLAFGIAVSASWWAARMGLAKLHVPRFPFVETAGRREHWLQIDPRALREWAMAPTAIAFAPARTKKKRQAGASGQVQVAQTGRHTRPATSAHVGPARLPAVNPASCHNCPP